LHEPNVGVHGREFHLENEAVNLVEDEDGLDALVPGLAESGNGLGADALDSVDDDHGPVAEPQRCRHFGREVNVAWGVDEVDEIFFLCFERGKNVTTLPSSSSNHSSD
jgi:hypothetical protein